MPVEQGGLGLGYLHHCIAMEELSRASGSGEGSFNLLNFGVALSMDSGSGTHSSWMHMRQHLRWPVRLSLGCLDG